MKNESPVLKRLGAIKFWRGHTKCLESLEDVYSYAQTKAKETLYRLNKK